MVRVSCLLASCVLIALLLVVPSSAYPSSNNYFRDDAYYDPEELTGLIHRLKSIIEMERKMDTYKDAMPSYNDVIPPSYNDVIPPSYNDVLPPSVKDVVSSEKRAFDLGLSRGYSGTLQAKHLMALAAANYAGGPGRRRRNAH